MNDTIAAECKSAIQELCEVAKLKCGDIVVVGCSTSEVLVAKWVPIPTRILQR